MSRLIKTAIALMALLFFVSGAFAFDKTGTGRLYHFMGDPYPRIMLQAFAYIDRQYVDPERAEPKRLMAGAYKALETRFPPVIIDNDVESGIVNVKVGEASKQFSTSGADDINGVAKVINEVLGFLAEKLVDEEKEDIYYAALNGAAGELDPHSNAITPKQFKEFMIDTRGSFGGIGFVFGIRDGQMMIITPIEGTPASRGGLSSGDRIIFINGEPTINMPTDVAASKMRGDPGTEVTLTIARDSWTEPRPLTFVREVIHVVSVEKYFLEKGEYEAPVLYLKVKGFQRETADQLKSAIREAEVAHPDMAGVVLDLRNNPGGLLDQAIELSDGFLEDGTIVSTKGREGEARSEATDDEPYTKKPLIILINQGSASASEIVSGALRPSRALLIGSKTFGKGSVQKLFPLPDRGGLKLTVAQYLTANDVSIQSIGIQPDIHLYSAAIEKATKLRIGPPGNHTNEADLENAFTDWGNASEEPWKQLQYLSIVKEAHGDASDESKPPEKSFAELTLKEKLGKLGEDFTIKLARRIMDNVPADKRDGAGRAALLKAAEPALAQMEKIEKDKIAKALAEIGVDWKGDKLNEPGKLTVELASTTRVVAGDTGKIKVTVRNPGSRPVQRIWGRSDSDNPYFKGRDFVFGAIAAGGEMSWVTEFKTPKSISSRWDPITVTLYVDDEETEIKGEGGVHAVAASKPDFGYSYTLSDINEKTPALSGNGIIDPGEMVSLKLKIDNIGEGESDVTEVNIRGEGKEQIFLNAARTRIEKFPAGSSREADMSFRFDKTGEEKNIVKIVVSITDMDNGIILSDELSLKVGEPYAKKATRYAPLIAVEKLPPLRTTAESVKMMVLTEDDGVVKEVYAYLDGKKIFYRENTDDAKKMKSLITVELKEGSNFLTIAARDNQEMVNRSNFIIYRAKSGEELAQNAHIGATQIR